MKKEKNQQNEFNNPAKSSPNVKEIARGKKPQRKAEKKQKRMKRNSVTFVMLQGILSMVFMGSIFTLGILPFSYAMIILLIVVLLFAVTWMTQKRKKAGRIFGRIYSLFVMIFLLCGSLCFGAANYILEEITDAPYEGDTGTQGVDLMNMDAISSISEDPFCIYVQDMKSGSIDIEGATDTQLLLNINMETHQVLRIATPGSSFVTIPDVTNGQKEKLKQAGEHGVEASISALSNLYETKIPYYLKVDAHWLADLQVLTLNGMSFDVVKVLFEELVHISDYIQTNMKKSEVQQLVKIWIRDRAPWKTETVIVTGATTKSYTYSSPKTMVSGVTPNAEQVKDIITWIDRMEEDEILKGLNPIILE